MNKNIELYKKTVNMQASYNKDEIERKLNDDELNIKYGNEASVLLIEKITDDIIGELTDIKMYGREQFHNTNVKKTFEYYLYHVTNKINETHNDLYLTLQENVSNEIFQKTIVENLKKKGIIFNVNKSADMFSIIINIENYI